MAGYWFLMPYKANIVIKNNYIRHIKKLLRQQKNTMP